MRTRFIISLSLVVLIALVGCGEPPPVGPTYPSKLVVTATPPLPTFELPGSFVASLSATPPDFGTPTPDLEVQFGQPFASATVDIFSPYTTQIVYACYVDGSDDICLMNADGSLVRQVIAQSGTDWYPSFSPDSRLIAFSSQGGSGNFDIYVVDTNGENLRRLTNNGAHNYAPAFSPDGARIVYASTLGGEGEQNIWIMQADGTNSRQLTNTPFDDIDPEWSPDGRQVSFSSNRNGLTDLYVMNDDGSEVRRLTFDFNVGGRNDWSPDGLYFTFYAGPQAKKEIYILEATCAYQVGECKVDPVQLTDGGNNKGPSFSPDGQWITYASNSGGDNEIYIMRIDGSDRRQITFNDYADWQPRWGP